LPFKCNLQHYTEEAELVSELRDKLLELSMTNAGVWKKHHARPEVPAPWWGNAR
jgi:hypothetical protein